MKKKKGRNSDKGEIRSQKQDKDRFLQGVVVCLTEVQFERNLYLNN